MIVDVVTWRKVGICFRALTKADVKKYGLTRRNGWFDWAKEFKNERNKVFGMFAVGNTEEIQGVIGIQEHPENQLVHVELVESAPHNQYNAVKQKYKYVGIHLICFAMHHSLQNFSVFEGYVGLTAKLNHNQIYYENLGGVLANIIDGKPYYYFDTEASVDLTKRYIPGGVIICSN